MAPVVTVAHWQVGADGLDAVLGVLEPLRTQSLSEPGCVGYEVLRDMADPTALVLIEHYEDDAALEAHLASAHYQSIVVEQVRPLLVDRRVEFLRPRE
jgi:quinol monooxygenase YgiN